jgi:hypothetical protein
MSSNVKEEKKTQGSHGPSSDSLGDVWEPKDDLAASIAENQRFKAEKRKAAELRRRRFRLTLIFLFVLLTIAGAFIARSYILRRKEIEQNASQELLVVVEPEANLIEYTMRKATVTLPNEGVFDLRRYEFDRNTFLRDKTVLNEENLFRETVSKISQELGNSWLIIFAGASVDGKPPLNRDLCRKRVIDVANMMRSIPGISANSLWGIPAGEKKLVDSHGRQLNETEEEEISTDELARERVLIVITVRRRGNRPGPDLKPSQQLIEVLYSNNLLPSDYDYPGRELAPI